VKFSYYYEDFYANPPAVRDEKGRTVPLEGVEFSGEPVLMERTLAPGKELKLCELNLELRPADESGKARPWTLYRAGNFQLQYEKIGGNIGTGEIKFDPILSKLATGKLDLEVKDAEKLPPKKEPEGFTAWGKEVGALQAGLGFRPGEKRAYGHGETVTLVVRVRNVGKKEVEFQYLKEFFKENPPIVTDADGKKLPGYKILFTPLEHVPEEVTLAPGKEIELSSEQYQLMPTSERGKGHSGKFLPLWTGTGKVSVQYNRLFGNTSAGRIKVDPDLLDLTTGSLELEIKPAPPPATEKK